MAVVIRCLRSRVDRRGGGSGLSTVSQGSSLYSKYTRPSAPSSGSTGSCWPYLSSLKMTSLLWHTFFFRGYNLCSSDFLCRFRCKCECCLSFPTAHNCRGWGDSGGLRDENKHSWCLCCRAPCLNAEEKLSPFIQQSCIHIWHGISKPCEMLDCLACICSSNKSLEPHDSCPSIHNLFFNVHWMKQEIWVHMIQDLIALEVLDSLVMFVYLPLSCPVHFVCHWYRSNM